MCIHTDSHAFVIINMYVVRIVADSILPLASTEREHMSVSECERECDKE